MNNLNEYDLSMNHFYLIFGCKMYVVFFYHSFSGEHVNTYTWPALISTTEVEDGGEKHASLSFYVSPEDTVLPTPNDASIRNETMPACTIYVR